MSSTNDFANLILAALGRQFTMMVEAKDLVASGNSLRVKFAAKAKNRANIVLFTYNAGADLIDVEFARYNARRFEYAVVERVEGAFIDAIRGIFEERTGLATRLF